MDGLRKKMRKGTKSCVECRRRKIRCTFTSDPATCALCLDRGIPCVDQRDAPRGGPLVATLPPRPRESLPHAEYSQNDIEEEHGDVGIEETDGADNRAPLASAMKASKPPVLSVHSRRSCDRFRSNIVLPRLVTSPAGGSGPLPDELGTQAACERLRATLPPFDALRTVLSRNGAWWASFRQKTHAISGAPVEGLVPFAARTYTSSSPAELGILVAAYARSVPDGRGALALVERLVVSDPARLATLHGIECLVLLAKTYTDAGQPRRAWLAWRRGMAAAQMMGLYRAADGSRGQMLWATLYHGDRFTSLLLGLPHGFNDNYYADTADRMKADGVPPEYVFVLQCAMVAGKVIDRNVAPRKPSFADAMALDEQMGAMAASLPTTWWDTPSSLPQSPREQDQLRDRVLVQFYFFHVKMYLHLPFMAGGSSATQRAVSRAVCVESARSMLKIFTLLRARTHGALFFECKTSDFVGFTAAVVLALGSAASEPDLDLEQARLDWDLIRTVKRELEAEAEGGACKISAQCQAVLGVLLANEGYSTGANTLEQPGEITIPYFGVIVKRRRQPLKRPHEQIAQDAAIRSPLASTMPSTGETPVVESVSDLHAYAQPFEYAYAGYGLPELLTDDAGFEFSSFGDFDAGSPSEWTGITMMDLDQDWSLFPTTQSSMFR